jgi:hypothetical protein
VDPEASTAKEILDDNSGISGGAAAAEACFHDAELDMARRIEVSWSMVLI